MMQTLGSFKRQQSTLAILNLTALTTLLLIHTFFANHFGLPTPTLVIMLAVAFLLRAVELIWVQARTSPLSHYGLWALTSSSIVLNFVLAFTAALLTNRPDAQYFVLLAMPIIEAAFTFSLLSTVAIIVIAGALNFLWIVLYVGRHGQIQPSEYFEAGTLSLIYGFVGVLVWMLVNDLRTNQVELVRNMSELEETRERLLIEEKLAAVGRLSSAIAHEIRNPVAMISSALATATRGAVDPEQRAMMFDIAAKEAMRLEQLTNDFLAYARPRPPAKSVNNVADVLAYVGDLSRAHADSKNVSLVVNVPERLLCDCDPAGLQQLILNLVLNAIDASPPLATVTLSGKEVTGRVMIEVENQGEAIAPDQLGRIFEPFFTTKPRGTGLGLAIARTIARSQGGDITLTANGPERVRFSVHLPATVEVSTEMAKL
ncbi:MAG: HAMP domain-containing sensor histidine kinase [Candidatus Korobacteraceae bacterium]